MFCHVNSGHVNVNFVCEQVHINDNNTESSAPQKPQQQQPQYYIYMLIYLNIKFLIGSYVSLRQYYIEMFWFVLSVWGKLIFSKSHITRVTHIKEKYFNWRWISIKLFWMERKIVFAKKKEYGGNFKQYVMNEFTSWNAKREMFHRLVSSFTRSQYLIEQTNLFLVCFPSAYKYYSTISFSLVRAYIYTLVSHSKIYIHKS